MSTNTLATPLIETDPLPLLEAGEAVAADPVVDVSDQFTDAEALVHVPFTVEPEQSDPTMAETSRDYTQLKKIGKAVLIRSGIEGVGVLVDGLLIGAGRAGVSALKSVLFRESVATIPEAVALDKVFPHNHNQSTDQDESRLKKAGRKTANIGATVATAVVAQKLGVDAASHMMPAAGSTVHEYVVPITSKVSALMALTAGQSKFAQRKTKQ